MHRSNGVTCWERYFGRRGKKWKGGSKVDVRETGCGDGLCVKCRISGFVVSAVELSVSGTTVLAS